MGLRVACTGLSQGGVWLGSGAARGVWVTQTCHASHGAQPIAYCDQRGTAKQKLAGLLAVGWKLWEEDSGPTRNTL